MAIKFRYNGDIYPLIVKQEFDYSGAEKDLQYEKFIAIYPNTVGDYDMAEIDSSGHFNLLQELSPEDVEVLLDGNAT